MGTLLERKFGIAIGECQVQRIMSKFKLTAITRQVRKAKPQAGKATKEQLPDNVLNRKFQADKPNQKMVTDVTYIPYYESGEWHWGYLLLVQDLFDRSIVAWKFSKKQDIMLSISALYMLRRQNLASDAMLHSDRGSIYTATLFREMLKDMGIAQSFSRTANCHDNATMECFNGTFKVEALYNPLLRQEHPSFAEQNKMIRDYIEYYNAKRPCSVIGNVPPKEYRETYYAENSVS